jgi:hypothetical protein
MKIRMMSMLRTPLALIALLALIGCGDSNSSGLPTTKMQIGSKTYTLEIAGTEDDRAHGLMERDTLDSDHGMIFVYRTPTTEKYWMHHTRFPLDIIFVDDRACVVSIATMKAYDESETSSEGPYKYAIELNAGQAAATGIQPKNQLHIPPVVDASYKN